MLKDSYSKIIDLFCILGEKIPGVYDLLVRGTFSTQKSAISDWSDLDFTVIVKEINMDVHHAISKLYQALSKNNDMKISVSLVDLEDLSGANHYHGMKPLYYSSRLIEARSVLIGDSGYLSKHYIFDIRMQLDCYTNIVYLMHDLRTQHMKLDGSMSAVSAFCKHMAKRVKHLIRNAIYIRSGLISEQINPELLAKYFIMVDKKITIKLQYLKENWPDIKTDLTKLLDSIDYLLQNAEIVHKEITGYINKINTTRKVENDCI